MNLRLCIYARRKDHEPTNYRWNLRDCRNDLIIAASSEGYRRRIDAVHNFEQVTGLTVPSLSCLRLKRGKGVIEFMFEGVRPRPPTSSYLETSGL